MSSTTVATVETTMTEKVGTLSSTTASTTASSTPMVLSNEEKEKVTKAIKGLVSFLGEC